MTQEAKYIVALDIGTSGCRAAAITPNGRVEAQCALPLEPVRPAEGLSEYKADELLQTQLNVLHAVLDQVGPHTVRGIVVASQRSTVVLWDKATGQAVAPILTWEDGRAAALSRQVSLDQQTVHAQTGLYNTPYFSAPKIAWCIKQSPAAYAALEKGALAAGPVASYLIWHLTNGGTFATDPTLSQRMLLMDIHTRAWSQDLCKAFEIPENILPAIYPSIANYGAYTYQEVNIPIVGCMGDQQAAAGAFPFLKNQSRINYGTGAFWFYNVGEVPAFLPGLLTSIAADGTYFLEGPVNSAASALLWLNAQGIEFAPEDTDAWCQKSKNPVCFLPALGGLGAPYWNFSVSPVAEGFSPLTRKEDWIAGTVRGIAFLIADIAQYAGAHGYVSKGPVYVSGGLSHISYLTQFQADLLQQPLHVCEESDATILGAARLAFIRQGADVKKREAEKCLVVSPQLGAEQACSLYEKWQQFVKRYVK